MPISLKKTGYLIFGSSERCADLLYLTGFQAEDPFLWYRVEDETVMVVSELEYGRALKQRKKNVQVLSYGQAIKKFALRCKLLSADALIAGISRFYDTYNWYVNDDFSYALACKVQASTLRLPEKRGTVGEYVNFFYSNERFCQEREIKTPDEIELLRHAERVAEKALQKGLDMLADSKIGNNGLLMLDETPLTSEWLHAEVNAELVRNGGFSTSTIIAPGIQASDPHQAGYGPIYAGAPIVFDIFPRTTSGYFGDLTRTVVKGQAPDIVKKAFTAVYDAQRTVIDFLKPGVTGVQAHLLATDILCKHNFITNMEAEIPTGFIHGLGHGVGLDIHETPSLNLRNERPLVAGNVVTVEPGVYYPEWGGIRIEDLVAITEDGVDNLTEANVFLEIQ